MIRHPAGPRHWMHRKPELVRRGAQAAGAKLSEADIARLREFARAGWQPSELASHFGVSRQTIWRHLRQHT